MAKSVSYQTTNTYDILYPVKASVDNIWIGLHGLGYLSRYFQQYFKSLDRDKNAVIIPQAPNKYYQDKNFKHVGACWLTRVDTAAEMKNNLNYLEAILERENLQGDKRIILMGYSQGVSIAMRWMVHRKLACKALIIHSGGIPKELTEEDGKLIRTLTDRIIHISGTEDPFVNEDVALREKNMLEKLFGTDFEQHQPRIKHEVATDLLQQLSREL